MTEIKAIKKVDGIIASLPDQASRKRVLEWAWKKFVKDSSPESGSDSDRVRSQ